MIKSSLYLILNDIMDSINGANKVALQTVKTVKVYSVCSSIILVIKLNNSYLIAGWHDKDVEV